MRVKGEYSSNKPKCKSPSDAQISVLFLLGSLFSIFLVVATLLCLGYLIFRGYSQHNNGSETTHMESESPPP